MTATYVVSTDFVARDLYSSRIKGMETATRKFATDAKSQFASVSKIFKGSFLGTFASNAVTSGIARISTALRSSVESFVAYDTALARMGLKFGDAAAAGSDAFKQLERGARAIGMSGDFSAEQAAMSLGSLATAGYGVKGALEALPQIVQFAEAANLDLAAATDISASSMRAFGVSTQQAAKIGDVYVTVAESARMTVDDLYSAVQTGGAAFAASGQSLETYLATVGYLGQRGVPASRSAMALSQAMIRLTAPSKAGAAALKKLGIATTEIVDGKERFRGFADIVGDLQAKTAGLADPAKRKIISQIFDARALKTLAPLLDDASGAFQEYADKIEKSGGRAAKVYETIEATTADKLEDIKGILEQKGVDIDAVVGAIKRFDVGPIVAGAKAIGKVLGFLAEHADAVITIGKGMLIIKGAMMISNTIKWGQAMVGALRGISEFAPQMSTVAGGMAAATAGVGGMAAAAPPAGKQSWFFAQYTGDIKRAAPTGKGAPVTLSPPGEAEMASAGKSMGVSFGGALQAIGVGAALGMAVYETLNAEAQETLRREVDIANKMSGGRGQTIEKDIWALEGKLDTKAGLEKAIRIRSQLLTEGRQAFERTQDDSIFSGNFWSAIFSGGQTRDVQWETAQQSAKLIQTLDAMVAKEREQQDVKVTVELTGERAGDANVKGIKTSGASTGPSAPAVNKSKSGKQ